jgi:Fic family protein
MRGLTGINAARKTINDHLVARIRGEFVEMPGLHLTLAQAQRLWGLDERTCREVLDALVDMRFLARRRNGAFARAPA